MENDFGSYITDSGKLVESLVENFNVKTFADQENNYGSNREILRNKPLPIDKEINLDPSKTIMSKTDSKGIIQYANEYFIEISGYEEYELMGQPHNIVRHPDMPKTIFKLMWDTIQKGENMFAFVKNMSKDGRYYWVLTNFDFKRDEEGNIVSYYSRRKAAPKNSVIEIERLYKTLKAIEQRQGMHAANNYFSGMLEEKNMNYNQFILKVLGVEENMIAQYFSEKVLNETINNETKKKGFFGKLFS